MKTIIYLSEYSEQLKTLNLDIYFPEAGLHPREVVKLIPELIGKSFCTHSEVIVNQFGHLIADKVINPVDVEIRLISDNREITSYNYDEAGYLIDWVIGFFE